MGYVSGNEGRHCTSMHVPYCEILTHEQCKAQEQPCPCLGPCWYHLLCKQLLHLGQKKKKFFSCMWDARHCLLLSGHEVLGVLSTSPRYGRQFFLLAPILSCIWIQTALGWVGACCAEQPAWPKVPHLNSCTEAETFIKLLFE